MTKKCFIKGVAIFLAAFQNIKVKDATQELWFELLKDLTDEQFLYSINKICIEVKEYYPSTNFIALVREQLKVNMDNEALLAWEAVKRAMAHQGAYCSVKFSDPAIHSVVNIMAGGWVEFCHMPLDKWMQKEFEKNYKILSARSEHPKYLKGIHEIENTANGFAEFMGNYKSPILIGTGTGKHKVLEGHIRPGERNVMSLAETVVKQLR